MPGSSALARSARIYGPQVRQGQGLPQREQRPSGVGAGSQMVGGTLVRTGGVVRSARLLRSGGVARGRGMGDGAQWSWVRPSGAWAARRAEMPASQVEVLGHGPRERRVAAPSDHSTPSARIAVGLVWRTRRKRRACRFSVFTCSGSPRTQCAQQVWAVGCGNSPHALVFQGFCRRGLVAWPAAPHELEARTG